MSIHGIARRGSANGVGTANTAPIYVNSSDNTVRVIPTGSGTTEIPLQSAYRPVINLAAASTPLTAAQSGSLVVFTTAAGQIAVLPAITVGLWFDFYVNVLPTSATHDVSTFNETTDFIIGAILMTTVNATPSGTAGPLLFQSLIGTSNVEVSMNGSTTGGSIGSAFRLFANAATTWQAQGIIIAPNGQSLATPFST